MRRGERTHLATRMKRSPVRRPAGFSSSGPSWRLSPSSRTPRAQDTDGFFVVEAAAGASGAPSAGASSRIGAAAAGASLRGEGATIGTSLRGEVAAAGAFPSPETGANGGGIEASGTSTVGVSSAVVAGGAPSPAELGTSELLVECGGEASLDGFVYLFGGALASFSFFFFFEGVAWRREVVSGSSS